MDLAQSQTFRARISSDSLLISRCGNPYRKKGWRPKLEYYIPSAF
jgi:hypothetical protein